MFYTLNNKNKEISELNTYNELANYIIIERKSKFISYVFNITDKEQAIEYINLIKKDNKEARHVVYIYSYLQDNKLNIKFSEDGEPQGTAIMPIKEMLDKEQLTNVCIVIVRYFGGILLGAGPLARVYLNTAKEAMNKCQKEEIYNYIDYDIELSYSKYSAFKYILDKYITNGYVILVNNEFEADVKLKLKVREDIYKDFISEINI